MASIMIGLNAVIVAVTDESPRILTAGLNSQDEPESPLAPSDEQPGLPYGPLDPAADPTLELSLRRWVREKSGLELGYVEQLYTFGDRKRSPQIEKVGVRVISVAYLGLMREMLPSRGAIWRDWYQFLPWEDWRGGPPAILQEQIWPALDSWLDTSGEKRQSRSERTQIAFGRRGKAWNWERCLDRYELLYEAGLIEEAWRDGIEPPPTFSRHPLGSPMILDHRRILATAFDRLRGKLKYRPVVFELLPSLFTLWQLQRLVEALAGLPLHKQNFRRLLERGRLVEGTGRKVQAGRGRPAELFRFRREVLTERPAPGVGLPTLG